MSFLWHFHEFLLFNIWKYIFLLITFQFRMSLNEQNLTYEMEETMRETVETREEIVETPGETCGDTMGNGRKCLVNWGNITLRESP